MTITSPTFCKRAGAITLAALTTISLASCAGETDATDAVDENCTPVHEFETIEPGVLTVATYDYPPFTSVEDAGLSGLEGDLLAEFADRECLTIEVSAAGGAGAVISSIETGRADLGAGGWFRTDERAEIVRLSTPILQAAPVIVSLEGITSDELGDGYRVGSNSGNLWNDSMSSWLGDDFAIYQDEEAMFTDLAAGRVDAVLAAAATPIVRFENNPIEGAEVVTVAPNDNVPEFARAGQVNFPTTLGNDALGEALDTTIEELREDGTLADIVEGYGIDPEQVVIDEVYNL